MDESGYQSGYVFEDSPELRKVLGDVDALRLQMLEGVARRLGDDTTLRQAIEFFRDPGPEPPPDRVPPSRRKR